MFENYLASLYNWSKSNSAANIPEIKWWDHTSLKSLRDYMGSMIWKKHPDDRK